MAFPTIPTVAAADLLSATTSPASTTHTFPNLSSLRGGAGPQAGDLLIAVIVQYQGGTAAQYSSWGVSLTEILDDALTSGTGNGALGVAYKVASGSESGTFTVTSANSFKSAQFLMRIPAATWHGTTAPAVQAATRAAGAVADPASFDPAGWAAEDTLWISVAGQTETSTTSNPPTLDTQPTNFTGQLVVARVADAVGDITAGVSFRQQNASAQDVGPWTASNALRGNGIATVIAVRPLQVVTETPGIGAAVGGGLGPTIKVDETIAGALGAGPVPTAKAGHVIAGALGDGVAPTAKAGHVIGGATAGGYGPGVPIFETPGIGGAVAGGVAPAPSAAVTLAGGVGQGVTPSGAKAAQTIGGANAAGNAASPAASVSIAGGVGQGAIPSPAKVDVAIAGAVAGGFAPGELITAGDTTTIGGATAGGFAPTASVAAAIGGANAGAVAPTERASSATTIAGAIADGRAPSERASSSTAIAGAIAGGFAPTDAASNATTISGAIAGGPGLGASADVSSGGGSAQGVDVDGAKIPVPIGGATAGGYSPTVPGAPVEDFTTIGGAIAGGFDPGGVRVPSELAGAIAAGLDAGAFVSVGRGGAIAGGREPFVAERVFEPPTTGEIVGSDDGAIIAIDDEITGTLMSALEGSIRGSRAGRISEPLTGRMV